MNAANAATVKKLTASWSAAFFIPVTSGAFMVKMTISACSSAEAKPHSSPGPSTPEPAERSGTEISRIPANTTPKQAVCAAVSRLRNTSGAASSTITGPQ